MKFPVATCGGEFKFYCVIECVCLENQLCLNRFLNLLKTMPQKINIFSNDGFIEFDAGSFDNWCVYITKPGGERFAPTDVQYFSRLKKLGEKYGHRKIYDDFVVIFNRTFKNIDPAVFLAGLGKPPAGYRSQCLRGGFAPAPGFSPGRGVLSRPGPERVGRAATA